MDGEEGIAVSVVYIGFCCIYSFLLYIWFPLYILEVEIDVIL